MFNKKGQNVAEYSILIALVIAAALAMQTYVKRGIQGRVADAVDVEVAAGDIGGGALNLRTKQYEPYYVQSNVVVSSRDDYTQNVTANGQTDKGSVNQTTTRGGVGATENIAAYNTATGRDPLR